VCFQMCAVLFCCVGAALACELFDRRNEKEDVKVV